MTRRWPVPPCNRVPEKACNGTETPNVQVLWAAEWPTLGFSRTSTHNTHSLGIRVSIQYSHGAEQYTEDLAVKFYGCHLDRTLPEIAAAVYCLMPSLIQYISIFLGNGDTRCGVLLNGQHQGFQRQCLEKLKKPVLRFTKNSFKNGVKNKTIPTNSIII